MTRIISFINLKGGVGKTTTTVAVGEILAKEHNKRVLVVDLDPQTNATVLLISQERWKVANENNKTIHQLFLDLKENTKAFNIRKSIIKGVSNIGNGIDKLDLLPSSIDLIDIGDDIVGYNNRQEVITSLKKELNKTDENGRRIKDKYDYILIDCPPNLGAITMCGVYISKYYIIPVLPDTLSTYGLKQVDRKINDKAREIKRFDEDFDIKPLGVLINRYRNTKSYNVIKDSLILSSTKNEIPKVFDTIISNTTNYADVCDFDEARNTIRQKYNDFHTLNKLVDEIKSRCDEYER